MKQTLLVLSNGTKFIKNKKGIGIREKPSDWTITFNIIVPIIAFAICFAKGLPILIGLLTSLFVGYLGYGILNQSILFLNTKEKIVVSRYLYWFVPFNKIKLALTADGGVMVSKVHSDSKTSIITVIDCSSKDEQNQVMEILYKHLYHS